MTTIFAIFIVAFVLSLVLTPLAGRLGIRFGALDEPEERKVYSRLIARCGGMGIFLSFLLALAVGSFLFRVNNLDRGSAVSSLPHW